jgi:hypothetical protein
MSEIHHAVDHWVEKNKKDQYVKGLSEGVKKGESGMLIFIILTACLGYGFYKYTQTHTIDIGIENKQVLGASSKLDTEIKEIPSTQITFSNDQSLQTTISPKGLDSKYTVDIAPSTIVRRGIFQPKISISK